jgi:hypothetical protein
VAGRREADVDVGTDEPDGVRQVDRGGVDDDAFDGVGVGRAVARTE